MLRQKAAKSVEDTKKAIKVAKFKPKKRFGRFKKAPETARPDDLRKLPSSFKLFAQACRLPARHWEIFGGIMLLFTILNVIMIGGFSQADDLQNLKAALNDVFSGNLGKLATGFTLFGSLIGDGTGTAANGAAQAYQSMLLVVFSLALIWALRQVYAEQSIRIRDAFYQGMQPLIPFVLVLLAIGLRMLPATFGGFIYGALIVSGVLRNNIEFLFGGLIVFILLAWTIYMLCSALFAAYIVTLPEMTPLQALRSSKAIVRFRRGSVLRKLLFLPLALFLAAAFIMVPVSLLLTPIAAVVFFFLVVIGVLVSHSYMYALYRELIV